MRLAELMAALSIATDLGMGQPMEYAMTTCIVAVRLGDEAGLSESDMRDAYYEALLRFVDCNADTYLVSSIFGDELAMHATWLPSIHPTASEQSAHFFAYGKINVSTRAAATLFAMENGLLE